MRRTTHVVAAAGLVIASAASQTSDWTQVTTANSPNVDHSHAMVYDAARDRVVMLGGFSAVSGLPNVTWEYDGVDWSQNTTASSPIARLGQAMVYDSARGKVVMFGGHPVGSSMPVNDTWEYDGSNWTQVTTSGSPIARRNHAMVYDSVRGKVVMFGGDRVSVFPGGSSPNPINDTWEYDGVNWALITTTTSPASRFWHAMAYDNARGQVVMFGGLNSVGWSSDTWEYDGVNWTQITTANAPAGRYQHAMEFDSVRGKVVLHGGFDASNELGDTWRYDGVSWTQIATANSPGSRRLHAVAYNGITGKVVMFGSYSMSAAHNDTWEFEGGSLTPFQSSATTYGTGCGSPALGFAATANPVIGTTASALILDTPTSLTGVAVGLSDTILSGLPVLPLDLSIIGMTGCELVQSNDVPGLPTVTLQPSVALFDLAIPTAASLLGVHVYSQAYAFAPGTNALQVIASNGIDWLIGNQ